MAIFEEHRVVLQIINSRKVTEEMVRFVSIRVIVVIRCLKSYCATTEIEISLIFCLLYHKRRNCLLPVDIISLIVYCI